MNQEKMLQMLSEGQTKVEQAHALILSNKDEDIEHLILLRKWLWQNADTVKTALRNESHIDHSRRQTLEKLVNDYTVTIIEIDDKINRDNLSVNLPENYKNLPL